MSAPIRLTNAQTRRFLCALHFGSQRSGLIEHVRGLGSVQFDPLNVVGRNADLVLQSRISGYKSEHLYKALYEDRLFVDGFDKCMCIFAVEDYPYFARFRAEGFWDVYERPDVKEAYPRLLEEIRARGPLCSSDFDMMDKVNWPWGPTKLARAALESLWFSGELMLSHKKGTRRYYDLPERVLPTSILATVEPNPEDDAYDEWLLKRRIGAVGMLWNRGSDAYLCMNGFSAERRNRAFDSLTKKEDLIPLSVDGIDATMYMLKRDNDILLSAMEGKPDNTMRFIAPLDNLIWDRKLIHALFGFYYRWEVYVPKVQRQFGYYVLPVLYGDRFVGRFEPDNFRKDVLVIKHWWWEHGVRPTKAMLKAREKALVRFCKYLGASGYQIHEEHAGPTD